jgi:protoporphyrinogen oxidase
MAGFGAAHQLHVEGQESSLYEQMPWHGGHTATYVHDTGFIFDDGPHVSFTKDERLQELFASSVDGKYEHVSARVNNFWKGYWIKHPAQCNLHGLPEDLVVKIIEEFVEVTHREPGKIRNYADWLYATYGATFAETFPMEYGFKYHTITAEKMTIDWLGPRMYRPSLEEVLRGALSPSTPDVHYVTHFRYPTHHGFASYLNRFLKETALHVDHKAVAIDMKARQVRFASGASHDFAHLISSVPLPDLIPMIEGAPKDVVDASQRLAWTTCVLVNIGVDRADLGEATWSYFYDQDIFFTRISYPHRLSPNNVPPGASSLQCEVYYSKKYRPMDRSAEDCIDPVIEGLYKTGLLQPGDTILHRNASVTPYANVIFDHDRAPALELVHGYLDDVGIAYCGRYGEWGHQWTDESFLSGEAAARAVLERA